MSSIGAAIGYCYTSLAAFSYARKENNGAIMATGVIGTILSLVFIALLLVPIPSLGCSLQKEPYICLIIWIIIGIVFFFTAKNRVEASK